MSICSAITTQHVHLKAQISTWRTQVADPYLASLPAEKRRLLYLKLQTEPLQDSSDGSNNADRAHTSKPLTTMLFSYQEGDRIVTQTQQVQSVIDLKASRAAYITFHILDRPLGVLHSDKERQIRAILTKQLSPQNIHTIDAWLIAAQYSPGMYQYNVHLPEGYTFTDIK